MKTNLIKKFGIAMVAILITVGFSAYKVSESNSNKSHLPPDFISWYFTGSEFETHLPEKYTDSNTGITCGVDTEVICEILAPRQAAPNQNKPNLNELVDPNLSDKVIDFINEAMNNLGQDNLIVQSFRESTP